MIFLTHRQLARMAQVTNGYHPENFYQFSMEPNGVALLEVIHITYTFLPNGTYSAVATDSGREVIAPTEWVV